ncbi:MAG: 30S ribosomal protein S15 [Mollicutes bacterium PWAP]|nr:30S ribosomal protein S15 [Mollicutes bacterium PWAP]
MITKKRREEIIKEFGGNVKNTGSSIVQIALLTEEIEDLKPHFEINKKDNHSRRGFLAKISKRKKLLSYVKKNDYDLYQDTIKKLGLRK